MNAVSTSDPDLINAAVAQFVEETSEPTEPTTYIPAQDRTMVLPGGLITPSGETITEIEVRELNGRDEEAISKCRTIGKALNLIVERGVAKVGGRTPTEMDFNSMLAGDRDAALLQIYSVTFGSEVQASRVCVSCSETVELTIDLDTDIPMRRLENPEDRYFTVTTTRGEARVELPTGVTQKALYENTDKSMAELSTLLLANTVTQIGNAQVFGPKQVQDLSIRDRRTIADEISKRSPGPQVQSIRKECPACGAEMEVAISVAALFQS